MSRYVWITVISILIVLYKITAIDFNNLQTFGFTPEYISIAQNTIKHRIYSDNYSYYYPLLDNTEINSNFYQPQTKREPLYPFAIIATKLITREYTSIVYLQIIALMITIAIWTTFILSSFGIITSIVFLLLLSTNPVVFFYSSVMYPYAFQLLFISIAIVNQYLLLASKRSAHPIIIAIAYSLTILERGALLLLPIFIFLCLWGYVVINRKIHLDLNRQLKIVIVTYIIIGPWIVRSLSLGFFGVNQMFGYSIGYTFGKLPSPSGSTESLEYDQQLKSFNNSDSGTISYIMSKTITNNQPYHLEDQEVARIVLKKMIGNKRQVLEIIINNARHFPARLIGTITRLPQDIVAGYQKHASLINPTPIEYLVFTVSLLYFVLNIGSPISLISISLVAYFFIFSTTIVVFDPRYRSITDLIVYLGLALWAKKITGFFKKHLNES